MPTKRLTFLFLGCLLTGACSGGGGGVTFSPVPPIPGPPPPTNQSPGGFWAGVVTFDMSQTSELFVALASEDGRFHFISAESETQFVGSHTVDVNHVVGFGLGYASPGTTWLDGTAVTDTATDAQLVERDSFSGIWSTASGESGDFDLFYDAEYERASSLPILEGVWTAFDEFGNPSATFTIDDQGQFTGQNTMGCNSLGQISIIDDRYNVYYVDSTISDCFIAGTYIGMAAVGDDDVTNDVILLAISNESRSIVLGLEK